MNVCEDHLHDAFVVEHRIIQEEIKSLDKKAEETSKLLDRWLNRGIGAWWIAAILILISNH